MENFNRQYRFSAGQAGSKGFEIGDGDRPLHISFSCEKADTDSANSAKVSLWNLNPEHLAELNRSDCTVSLRAGYGSVMPLIFAGVVTFVKTSLDGSDVITELEIVDNRVELRDTFVSVSYRGSVNCKKLIQDAASQMGVAVAFSYNATFKDIPNGYSYVGGVSGILSKACETSGLVWNINNGVLQIKKPNGTINREVYELSADTGLVGIPERVQISGDSDGSEQYGWDIQYLMNAAINVDDYIYLNSIYVKGYFRVYSVSIDGDNYGDSWNCSARLLEV